MAILVGSARIDENGKAMGGKVGDQTGKEVMTQALYTHPKGWYILRIKDGNSASKLANAMITACKNDNIGYDQSNRLGVIKYGINTTVKTEADCSSLVRACIINATGKDVGNFTTANQVSVLEKSGLFENHIAYTSSSQLYNGDILVTKTQGHTVIVVSGAKDRIQVASQKTQVSSSFLPSRGYFKYGDVSENIGKIASFMRNTFPSYTNAKALGNTFGPNLLKAIKEFQRRCKQSGLYNDEIDGMIGEKTLACLKHFGFKE